MTECDSKWERQHLCRVMFDDLKICGCNQPGEAYSLVRNLLAYFAQDHADRDLDDPGELIGTDGAVHLVLCMLDNANLIEHGGTVAGAWLTDKGRAMLEMMRRHEWDGGEDGTEGVDETGYPHGGADCTPACWTPREPAPPRRSTAEVMKEMRAEADAARARMTPVQRAIADAHTDLLLHGETTLPAYWPIGVLGALPGDPVPAHVEGLRDVLATLPGGEQVVRVINANLARAAEGYAAALTPAPPPKPGQFLDGCRKVDGTWIHGRRGGEHDGEHTCPKWAR